MHLLPSNPLTRLFVMKQVSNGHVRCNLVMDDCSVERLIVDVETIRELPNRQDFTECSHSMIELTPVIRLNASRRPITITRRIRTIVATPFECVPCRPRPEITYEGAKVIHPPVTDRDAATSITWKIWSLRVQAALFHQRPRLVFRRTHNLIRQTSRKHPGARRRCWRCSSRLAGDTSSCPRSAETS